MKFNNFHSFIILKMFMHSRILKQYPYILVEGMLCLQPLISRHNKREENGKPEWRQQEAEA